MRWDKDEFDARWRVTMPVALAFIIAASFGWGAYGFLVGWIGWDIYKCLRGNR